MRKSYLFAYSDRLGTREEVKECVESIPEILIWRYDIPNCFYLVSNENAKFLAEKIQKKIGSELPSFIITEIQSNFWGWLSNESWYVIEKKKLKPE